ncbi:MAG: hypothetical protein HQL23_02020 [Candidatus Omnitrophica bacterium]|nr:hypothetical protein [Candidatus Omnitrophota bacterium]
MVERALKAMFCAVFVLGAGLCGCGFFRSQRVAASAPALSIQYGRILEKEVWLAGGKIGIVPFRPGDNVEDYERSRHAALMMVKGLAETVTAVSNKFKMVYADKSAEADFVINGHITDFAKNTWWQRWGLRPVEIRIRVEGDMTDRRTGEKVLLFAEQKTFREKGMSEDDVTYIIGENIGRFIAKGR